MSRILDEHRIYVGDPQKTGAYARALAEQLCAGDRVLDLGAGTGLLGLLACQAGAGQVYAVDDGGIIELARQLAVENGFSDRIQHVRGLSSRIELPEPVELAMADQVGVFGVEAGVLQYFADVKRRLLAPGGKLMPYALRLFAAPVHHAEAQRDVSFWTQPRAGLRWKAALEIAENTIYSYRLEPEHLLGGGRQLVQFELGTPPSPFQTDTWLELERDGGLDGIGVWWEAQLSPSVVLTTSPLSAQRIDRRNAYLPLPAPVSVLAGERVRLQFAVDPVEAMITWSVELYGPQADKPHQRWVRSTFRGMLLSKEDIRRTRPSFVPRLDPWGQARKSVLDLCDGKRSLAQIETELLAAHPELFPTLADAAKFAAEVVTRYAV